jgi:hypothetical protein
MDVYVCFVVLCCPVYVEALALDWSPRPKSPTKCLKDP